jgi:ATPase subunit of ABC transporter with duplicated ATPase domains
MARVDKDICGETKPHPAIKGGYLAQEPDLGDAKTVREAVDEGVKEVRALLTEFEELGMKLGEPMSPRKGMRSSMTGFDHSAR